MSCAISASSGGGYLTYVARQSLWYVWFGSSMSYNVIRTAAGVEGDAFFGGG